MHDPSLFFIFHLCGLSLSFFLFDMPCGHVVYLLWVCIFLFLSFFFIAHILDGQERKSHGMSWSFILWVDDSVCYVRGRVRDLDHDSMTSLTKVKEFD